jgi:hypothetical protein
MSTVNAGPRYLLDTLAGQNAAAAYSLRRLRRNYAGAAIRVRRSNDNAEQDIGFDANGNLDETALTAFVGANSGFVTRWYDQSGNVRNATQTTAANQPRIVNAGVVERQNNKVSIFYDGSNDNYTLSDFALPTSSIFSAANNTVSTASNIHTIYCRGTFTGMKADRDALLYVWRTNNNIEFQRSNSVVYPTATRATTIGNFSLYGGIYTGTQLIAYNNGLAGTAVNTTISGVSSNPVSSIGATYESGYATYYFGGFISEVVVYASNQSSNRTGIENNINNYYRIY